MNEIAAGQDTDSIKFHGITTGANKVFSITQYPNLIFKTALDYDQRCIHDKVKDRYQQMVKARAICQTHDLGLLVIPEAVKFLVLERKCGGRCYTFIAERHADIAPTDHEQERLYAEHADRLTETIRQLTTFICKSGFSDVAWRNVPICNDSLKAKGDLKVVLIDLEEMLSAEMGLFGHKKPRRHGLISCVMPEQADIVIEEARKHLPWTDEMENQAAKAKELRSNEWEFYQHHGLLEDKNKPIPIPEEMIKLLQQEDVSEESKEVLVSFARQIFDYIAKNLASDHSLTPDCVKMSTRERRRFDVQSRVTSIKDKDGQSVFLSWLETLRQKQLISGYNETGNGIEVLA